MPGQEGAALDEHEVSRHHDEFPGQLDVEPFKGLHPGQILLGDPVDRDVLDIDLVLLDQEEQQIQRPVKDVKGDVVRGQWGAQK